MLAFLGTVHIIIALLLIFLVLVQDSKGGMGALGGGGGSNSVLGAAGAENILAKMTRWVAICFGVSCVLLTIYSSRGTSSVVDDYVPTQVESTTTETPENKDGATK